MLTGGGLLLADVPGILLQTASLEGKLNAKRVGQICGGLTALLGLLVEAQAAISAEGVLSAAQPAYPSKRNRRAMC